MANRIPKREEQNPANCWSIEDLYESDAKWEEDFQAAQTIPEEAAAFQGTLGRSAEDLLKFCKFEEYLTQRLDSLMVYPMLRRDEDSANPAAQDRMLRCRNFGVKFGSAMSFVGPELTAIPEETLEQFYKVQPELEQYRRYLALSRRNKDHILGAQEEQLMASMGQVTGAPSQIFHAFTDADLKFPDALDSKGESHTVTAGTFYSCLISPDRTLRKNAFRSIYDTYLGLKNGYAALMNAEVQTNVFRARARHYSSAMAAALFGSEIPEAVYTSLLDSVHRNLEPMYKYMELRRKTLGLDQLHMYDIHLPILPEASQVYPFEKAKELVLDAMQVYGEAYHSVLASAFEQRWMDVYENQGKTSGAYSCGCRVHPYVLLNHTDSLDSVFTLAHEMGHAMHSWLSTQNQPPLYADYTLFVAEVASTVNESILMQYLLNRTEDKTERAVLINYFLDQYRITLYRQAMLAEFELKIHTMAEAGTALTAESMSVEYKELVQLYFGPDVVADEGIELEWARIPHFYRNFYVYQYATGFSAAMALSQKILREGEPAVQAYLRFLSGGCSKDPITLLQEAGVDLSTPAPVDAALARFAELEAELESLLA